LSRRKRRKVKGGGDKGDLSGWTEQKGWFDTPSAFGKIGRSRLATENAKRGALGGRV